MRAYVSCLLSRRLRVKLCFRLLVVTLLRFFVAYISLLPASGATAFACDTHARVQAIVKGQHSLLALVLALCAYACLDAYTLLPDYLWLFAMYSLTAPHDTG